MVRRTIVLAWVSIVVACTAPEASGSDATVGDASSRARCAADVDCSDGVFCNGAERCAPASSMADARGCIAAPAPACLAGQTCDEAHARCETDCDRTGDADHDGQLAVRCGGDDCDDMDPNRRPGLTEVCDPSGHDEDCDPTTYGVRDADMDGAPDAACCNTAADGTRHCGTDCDDTRASANPTSPEVCNGIDDDCDAAIDEGVQQTFTIDSDGDGHGDASAGAATMMACFSPTGYAASHDDCDDTRGFVSPSGVEVCDEGTPPLDEDCDGVANDVPGGCECTGTASRDCGLPGHCAGAVQTCLGGHYGPCSIEPVLETCNGIDDDCDGVVDDGVSIACYPDVDNDGFAAAASSPLARCPDPSRPEAGMCPVFTTPIVPGTGSTDCDDVIATTRPGAVELCDGVDQDCDGAIDEGARIPCYPDMDDDTYAPAGATTTPQCRDLTRDLWGYCPAHFTSHDPSTSGSDCDDGDPSVHPNRQELCNSRDDDCDTTIDEGARLTCYTDLDNDGYSASATSAMLCASTDASRAAEGFCPISYTNEQPTSPASTDCDDANATRNPGALEICNGIDDDCDGVVEEGLSIVPCFPDGDDDTYAAAGATSTPLCSDLSRAAWGNCPRNYTARDPSMTGAADCADSSATVHPGAIELCDLPSPPIDENCNGLADEPIVTCYTDLDNDGYAPSSASPVTLCRSTDPSRNVAPYGGCPPSYTARVPMDPLTSDCDDSRSAFAVPILCYTDGDSDGYGVGTGTYQCPDGASGSPTFTCASLRTNRLGDCCDLDARAFPGAGAHDTQRACRTSSGAVSFDFNCDGTDTRTCTTVEGTCMYPGTGALCYPSSYGCWYGTVPGCGGTGTTLSSCGGYSLGHCSPSTSTATQTCR